MCGVKLVNKRNTEDLIDMLGLKEAANKLARANGVRWYGHVLRRPEEDILMKAMIHKVDGKRKQDEMEGTSSMKHENWFKERRCGRSV